MPTTTTRTTTNGIHEVDAMNWAKRLEKRIPPTDISKAKTADERRQLLARDLAEYRGKITILPGPPEGGVPPAVRARPVVFS